MYSQSILVSNIFDPLTHSKEELENLYIELANQRKYKGIETRIIHDDGLRSTFNELVKKTNWVVTYWVTGEIDRAGLNPSSTDKATYQKTIKVLKELIDIAAKGKCAYFGIASGKSKGKEYVHEETNQFENTVRKLLKYMSQYDGMKMVVEPLDTFAHKKNVLGDTKRVVNFLKRFEGEGIIENDNLSICWDSAHVALNEDDFTASINQLAPYISRVHYSNAILDKSHTNYGDWHMKFIKPGFITLQLAQDIIINLNKNKKQNEIFISCEVRTTEAEECWNIEKECYAFVEKAINGT